MLLSYRMNSFTTYLARSIRWDLIGFKKKNKLKLLFLYHDVEYYVQNMNLMSTLFGRELFILLVYLHWTSKV